MIRKLVKVCYWDKYMLLLDDAKFKMQVFAKLSCNESLSCKKIAKKS